MIAELKRRKVFKVGVAYLVVGWLLIQIAATVAPQLNLPEWAPRLITFVILLGFPVAILLAWVVDLSPDGIKIVGAPLGNKRIFATVAVLVALAVGWYWKGQPALQGEGSAARSIAVLPFANMSGDPANEYFSDGISEEILNVLARTPELQVAARTSSFSFKGKTEDIPQIARALKVRMVLEGSVRKQGDRIRITAQLIDAKSGFHAWSQTYDRKLADIFAIQDEIARAIGDELKVRIVGAEEGGAVSAGTMNLEAHDLYLRGLALWQRRREAELWQAIDQFERAAAADPKFAQAYAGQALVYVVLPDYSARISYAEAFARARDNAERALGLDATLPEPYAVLASLADNERRRATSESLYQRAITLRPSFATAYQWFGNSMMSAGKLGPGLASLEHASVLDPRSLIIATNRAWILITLGRYADAKAVCEPILEFAPKYAGCLEMTGLADLLLGDLDSARSMLDQYSSAFNPSAHAQVNELINAMQGHGDRHAIASQLASSGLQSASDPTSGNVFLPNSIPMLLVLLGEQQMALAYLEKIANENSSDLTSWAVMPLALAQVRCDPRFVALVKQLKTTDPHYAKVCGGQH
ncbi:MAG: hypothetical protein ABIW35_05380 [Luteimonas sp.]